MISHALKLNASKTIMMGLRACGPWTTDEMKRELLIQCLGVTKENVDEVFEHAFKLMNHKHCPMVEVYFVDEETGETSYSVADRMYDDRGEYKGDLTMMPLN